jgi:hypothetical protein
MRKDPAYFAWYPSNRRAACAVTYSVRQTDTPQPLSRYGHNRENLRRVTRHVIFDTWHTCMPRACAPITASRMGVYPLPVAILSRWARGGGVGGHPWIDPIELGEFCLLYLRVIACATTMFTEEFQILRP